MVARLVKLMIVSVILLGSVGVVRAAPAANLLGYQYVHYVTSNNTVGSTSLLDNPLLNGNPNAIFFITHNWNPGGVGNIYQNINFGVYYDGTAWRIFSQGFEAITKGASFNVFIPTPGSNVFVHKANASNTLGHVTYITNPLTDASPNAMLLITPNWNPVGSLGVYNNNPTGVFYTDTEWAIFNQNSTAMPIGASFNVMVIPADAGFIHTATTSNTSFNATRISNPLTDNRPNALLFITPNWNPGGVGGTYVNSRVGVYYSTANQAAIFIERTSESMPSGASFNVLALPARSDFGVHQANSSNILGNSTEIRTPSRMEDPNTLVFATQNWNPGGFGGTYNNRNIGVWFNTSWLVFN